MGLLPARATIPLVLAVASLTFNLLMLQKLPIEQAVNEYRDIVEKTLPSPMHFSDDEWYYLDHLPAPGQAWPAQVTNLFHLTTTQWKKNTNPNPKLTLTTGIPALNRNIEQQLPNVLRSIAAQTVRADEVVIVISNVVGGDGNTDHDDDGTHLCRQLYTWMHSLLEWRDDTNRHLQHASTHIRLRLLCVGERLTAGRARNAVGRLATSDIVSFIDADDQEFAHRNAVIKQQFACFPERKMVLHQFDQDHETSLGVLLGEQQPQPAAPAVVADDRDTTDSATTTDVEDYSSCDNIHIPKGGAIRGSNLYDILQQTHERWWLRKDLAHGHAVVHRSVFSHVSFSSMYKGEDAAFVRDVIYQYGPRNDDAVIYLKRPLTSYVQSNQANKDLLEQQA